MATFVLIHGAWHGGWCWQRVAPILREAGHEVVAPTLRGLGPGERTVASDEARPIDLESHVEQVLDALRARVHGETVLCGHSYGGMVITGAADRAPDRIRALVYLDALVPEDGRSLLDLIGPERAAQFREAARSRGDGISVPPLPAERYGSDPRDRAWIDRECVPHPLACFEQPLRLTGAWKKVPRRIFVRAPRFESPVMNAIYEGLRTDGAWHTLSVPCGHEAMLDLPGDIAGILMDASL